MGSWSTVESSLQAFLAKKKKKTCQFVVQIVFSKKADTKIMFDVGFSLGAIFNGMSDYSTRISTVYFPCYKDSYTYANLREDNQNMGITREYISFLNIQVTARITSSWKRANMDATTKRPKVKLGLRAIELITRNPHIPKSILPDS